VADTYRDTLAGDGEHSYVGTTAPESHRECQCVAVVPYQCGASSTTESMPILVVDESESDEIVEEETVCQHVSLSDLAMFLHTGLAVYSNE
jgi:hypothetical protein